MDDFTRRQLREIFSEFLSAVESLCMDAHRKGAKWECDMREMAQERGLHVEPGTGRADMVINGKRVQCKAMERIVNGVIDIRGTGIVKANGNHRGYLAGEYDVFALRHNGNVYLIPEVRLRLTDFRMMERLQICRFSDCIDNWSVFDTDYTPPQRPQQKRLFDDTP